MWIGPICLTIMIQVQVMYLFFVYMTFNFLFFRAKKELHANMAVTHSWSEFNALLDKQKVCAFSGFRLEGWRSKKTKFDKIQENNQSAMTILLNRIIIQKSADVGSCAPENSF